ncbi:MAG: hypothetical protein K2P65_09275 [Lachnospiraceae bacterium]|nr:hypothetical protein [Lachnospiraceae bacterium]
MKKWIQQKWLLWLAKYWFLFPIVGFLVFEGVVFFWYGEKSYIGVHDNMDLFLAQFQMLKNTGSFGNMAWMCRFLAVSVGTTCPRNYRFIVSCT